MPNSSFLEAQLAYESLGSIDLTSLITSLDNALSKYANNTGTKEQVESAFAPIAEYYSKVSDINKSLQSYINSAAKNIADSDPRLINEERYTNRAHPEYSIAAREASWGFFPELRVSSIPYLIAVSVFMASLSIFLIFQMFGFSGQVNIPSSLLALPASSVPFYQNPMVIGGFIVLLIIACITFAVLYFKANEQLNK
jgi:hypothetical protein